MVSSFKYLCVLDFEAVFQENPQDTKNKDMEIIEFPSVLYQFIQSSNKLELHLVDEFQQYVKTRRIPVLNEYCIQQTGITQQQVDNGISFKQVIQMHTEWLRKHLNCDPDDQNVLFVTCGDWDLKTMIPHQLSHETDVVVGSHLKQWCNIKWVFDNFYKKKKKVSGMMGMLNQLKLPLLGRHHCGIDDCRNIGRVAAELVKQGCSFAPSGRHGTNGKVIWLQYDPAVSLSNFEVAKPDESNSSKATTTSSSTSNNTQKSVPKKTYSRVQHRSK
jgi:inhibitor of KinA sporulation pathway (predicted exonuclease)